MAKKQPEPIITHVEIYARAIRSIQNEITEWEDRCKSLPQEEKEQMLSSATAHLKMKLEVLQEMYWIESGNEYS